jgi:hypothetical protein
LEQVTEATEPLIENTEKSLGMRVFLRMNARDGRRRESDHIVRDLCVLMPGLCGLCDEMWNPTQVDWFLAPSGNRVKTRGPGTFRFRGQTWGWELATLSSRSHTLGALAFAGRVLPDATLRGMRRSRSHGGTVSAVTSRNLSSEASTPGSATACQRRSRRTRCRHAYNLHRSRRHRYHGVGPGFWPGVGPMLRV